jgi:hypothetical protein
MFVRPRMTDQKDGSLLFEVTLNHDREFLNWVYSYGPNAEILEPKSYRDKMRKQLERWQQFINNDHLFFNGMSEDTDKRTHTATQRCKIIFSLVALWQPHLKSR